MSNYLRNRPFMLVNFTYVLKDGQDSRLLNFRELATWDPIEKMAIVDRVSSKQLVESELVLDLFENKVIKCRDASIDHDQIFSVMVKRHMDEIRSALAEWIKRDSNNLTLVREFVARFTNKEENNDDLPTSDQ